MADPFGNISAQERLKIMAEINEEAKTLRSIEEEYGRLIKESGDALESRSAKYTREKNAIESLSSSVNKDLLNQKDLETKITKIKRSQLDAEVQIFVLKEKIKAVLNSSKKINNEEIDTLKKAISFEQDRANTLASAASNANKLLEESKRISRLNPFKGLSELITGVPILSSLLKDLTNATDAFNVSMSDGKGFAKSFSAGFLEFFKLISKSAQVFVVKTFIDAFKKLDTSSVGLANQLNISKIEATELKTQFTAAAQANNELLLSSFDLIAAQVKIGNALGTTGRISNDMASSFTIITDRLGVSEQAAAGLASFSAATGMNFREFSETVMGTTKVLGVQEEFLVNEKDIFEDISKVSSNVLLSMKGQNISLEKSAFQARKLGLTLSDLEKTQSALLNFEQSIADELSAELITGQNLNLEKARLFALNNNLLGLGEELEKQGITQEKFTNMNAIAQQAIAKSLGMSSKDMGEMFVKQKAIQQFSKLRLKDEKDIIQALKKRIDAGESEAKLIKEFGDSEFINRARNLSVQEKMNKIIEKMYDVLDKFVKPVFQTMEKLLNKMGDKTGIIIKGLGALAIGGPIYRGISIMSKLFGGMARSARTIQGNMLASTMSSTLPGKGINPGAMYSSPIGPVMKTKNLSKASRIAKFGKGGGLFALLGLGLDAASNFTDDSLSGEDATLKTLDQNKFTASGAAIGAGIGALFGGVGALPGAGIGAGIGGIMDAFAPLFGEYGDKVEGAIDRQTQALQNTPPQVVLSGTSLNQVGIPTLNDVRRLQ